MKQGEVSLEIQKEFPRSPDNDNSVVTCIKEAVLIENKIALDLLTIEQIAAALGKQVKIIRNMVAKRLLPFVKIGRKTYFRRSSIDAWLAEKEVKPWGGNKNHKKTKRWY